MSQCTEQVAESLSPPAVPWLEEHVRLPSAFFLVFPSAGRFASASKFDWTEQPGSKSAYAGPTSPAKLPTQAVSAPSSEVWAGRVVPPGPPSGAENPDQAPRLAALVQVILGRTCK